MLLGVMFIVVIHITAKKNTTSERNTNIMCRGNASYGVVNAENRLDFTRSSSTSLYSIILHSRELTDDDLYATIQDTPQDIKVINLSSVQYIIPLSACSAILICLFT